MDTRHPIQLTPEPAVLSVSFNPAGTRFCCGLDNGIRMFKSNDCIRTLKESPEPGNGIAIAVALDDKYIALVGGGRKPNSSPNILHLWDNLECHLLNSLDFAEPILGIRITTKALAVVLKHRTVFLQYGQDEATGRTQLGGVLSIHDTASNPYALCCVRGNVSVLPGLTPGQVQIVRLTDRSKKIVRAHHSDLRQLDLSADGQVLATASKQGTLIRIFSTSTLSQTHEFRRGVDAAVIYSLSISPQANLVACSSDKGTIHIFDLRPHFPPVDPPHPTIKNHPSSRQTSLPPRSDLDTLSLPSHSSSPYPPSSQASTHHPPPDLTHSPPANAPSALSALARLPGMPRALSDARSLTSCSYYLGSDPPNWQGQPAYITTTLPNGNRGRVKNPNLALPGMPEGRPVKGVLCWDPESDERRIWCVGGGADARWEVFELLESETGRLKMRKKGWRAYLKRQFPEEGM